MKRLASWLMAVLLCCLAINPALAVRVYFHASDYPDTNACRPAMLAVRWIDYQSDQGGWTAGELTGPSGYPSMYLGDWCDTEIPLYALVVELLVTLNTGVAQYVPLSVLNFDCDENPPFPVVLFPGTFTGCEEMQSAIGDPILPQTLSLAQNYPNPFNPSTNISFNLPMASHVSLAVYNLGGQLVSTLANERMNAGEHQFIFHAGNLPSGVYFYVLSFNQQSEAKQMTLSK